MIHEFVIIGGGVAGLCAANQLVDRQKSVLLIDAGNYPSHRLCGEFFSPECHPLLQQWGLPLSQPLYKGLFFNSQTQFPLSFSSPAKGCSRYVFDESLFQRAQNKGAEFLLQKQVQSIGNQRDYYTLLLDDGQIIIAQKLLIGTGKIPYLLQKTQTPNMHYYGFKCHFEGILKNDLEMHTFPYGYLGISQIEEGKINVAGLVLKQKYPQFVLENFLTQLKVSQPQLGKKLGSLQKSFPTWLIGQIPEFGIRSTPSLKNIFWIGDAAASIPPLTGAGLAIAITSGKMAADFAIDSNETAFKKTWLKRYQRRLRIAYCMHQILLNPWANAIAFKACALFPQIPEQFWKWTRE